MVDEIICDIKQELGFLLNKDLVFLTKRGNDSIEKSLFLLKTKLSKTKCFILDQGGWITYPKYIKKAGLEEVIIKTVDCKINLSNLSEVLDSKSIILISSLSGYWYKQPISEIYSICKKKGCTLVNDCSGSISDEDLILGDVIIGSFGRWKPINNESGGFISFSKNFIDYDFLYDETTINSTRLLSKIKTVKKRVMFLNSVSLEIINLLISKNISVLNNYDNNSNLNLVVIALFETDLEKEIITSICDNQGVSYEICPRDIRSLKKAISIEVKRLS